MLKRILSAVGIIVVGFAVVVAVVYIQLRGVQGTLHQTSKVDVPLYRAAVAVTERTSDLEKAVSTSFLSVNQADLDDHRKAVREGVDSLNSSVQRLVTSELGSRESMRVNPGASDDAVRITSLTTSLKTNLSALIGVAERTVDIAGQQLQLRQELGVSREDLSKAYRKTFALAKADEKSFATLSRAVITTLHSASTSDLNFIGRAKFKEALDGFAKATLTPEQKELLDSVTAQFNRTFDQALAASAAKADWAVFADRVAQMKTLTGQIRRISENQFEAGQTLLTTDTERTVKASIWLSVATIFIGTIVSFFMARSITRRIGAVSERLRQGANEVSNAASQMEGNSTILSEGASSQAASLEETSASLTEMASMSSQTANNATGAKSLSVETRTAAETGVTEVTELETAMKAIRESSNSIGKIVKSIDEIAFQTNILALNAAVEAARAGEAGLGFAVVADEVRNLAQRSALAARETADKIQDSIDKSERGARISAKVAQSLQTIVGKTQKVDQLIGEIAIAAKEQSEGVGQITTAVSRIDQITQQSASSAEENATAAVELRAQAESLRQSIEDLSRLVGSSHENESKRRAAKANAAAAPSGNQPSKPQAASASSAEPPVTLASESPAAHAAFPMPPQPSSPATPARAADRTQRPAETKSENFKDF